MRNFHFAAILLLTANLSMAGDYSALAKSGDNFKVTAAELTNANAETWPIVVWLGKVLDVSVYTKKDGATAIEWFCEQHQFDSEPSIPLTEPFSVEAKGTGHFVVSLNLPTLSLEEAKEKIVAQLNSPAWVLVRGDPVHVRAYKGTNAVFLHSLNMAVSDTMKIRYGL